MSYLPLPADTKKAFNKNKKQSDNAFLLFNRYLEGKGFNYETFDTKDTKDELYGKIKKIKFDLESFAHRAEASLIRLQKAGYKTHSIKLSSVSRLIVGLGDKNALEVGFTFHPLYGYPYIPGSSLKGLCRSWLEIAENEFDGDVLEGDSLQSKIDLESRQIFGSLKKNEKTIPDTYKKELESKKESISKLGDVMFFDAVPTEDSALGLDIDIMNPHYSPYYTDPEKSPPGDWYSPVPIKFLTVKEGATFAFFLASKSEVSLNKAAKWLVNGLSELGIGSKTSSGYGYFDSTDLEEIMRQKRKEAVAENLRRIEELKQKAAELKSSVRSPKELFEERLATGTKEQLGGLIYESWMSIDSEEDKIQAAKAIVAKFSKVLEKKKGKGFVKEILKWAEK